jgi:hypothetical protein
LLRVADVARPDSGKKLSAILTLHKVANMLPATNEIAMLRVNVRAMKNAMRKQIPQTTQIEIAHAQRWISMRSPHHPKTNMFPYRRLSGELDAYGSTP